MADDIPPELSDAALLARANRAAMAGQPGGYTSSILPFTYDAQGKRTTDWSVGLPGMLGRAFSAPADAVSGNLPVIGPQGGYNPELISRANELAGLIASPNPAVASGERVIPGVMMGGPRPGYTPVPTAQELRAAGGAGYDAARASGMEISAGPAATMAQRVQADLYRQGFVPETSPLTHSILDRIANPPPASFNTVDDLLSMRAALGKVGGESSDQAAAAQARRAVDQLLGSVQPSDVRGGTMAPQQVADTLREASQNYAAAMRSNDLTGTLDRANTGLLERAQIRAGATNSGRNLDNTIRQRVASFLEDPKNVAGLSNEELAALNQVVAGTATQNAMRYTSNLLGGGGGLGQALMGGMGAAAGGAAGSPWYAALGAVAPAATGAALKAGENLLARRGMNAVDEMMRMRSPLYQQNQAMTPSTRSAFDMLREYLMPGAPPLPPGRAITPY